MPQDHINFKGRRRGTCHNACKENGQSSCTDLVNGPTAPNGCKASASTTSESTPAVSLNGTKPHCMVNGYINHGCKGKSTKTQRKEFRRISAATDDSAAGRVSDGGIPGDISVSGVTSLDADSSPHNSDQMTPDHSLLASLKNRGRKKFRRKKRETKSVSPENCKFPFTPPQDEENWENEIQDTTLPDGETMCFGVKPYGPEDVLHFALRELTLKQGDTVDVPVTTNYSPAVHHQHPVQWLCCSITPEPDQFADAEE